MKLYVLGCWPWPEDGEAVGVYDTLKRAQAAAGGVKAWHELRPKGERWSGCEEAPSREWVIFAFDLNAEPRLNDG